MQKWISVLALVVACVAVLADSVSTREGLRTENLHERNKIRAFLIKLFGINGGTYGVSLVVCAGLVCSFLWSAVSPTQVFCYVIVACACIYAAWSNHTKLNG